MKTKKWRGFVAVVLSLAMAFAPLATMDLHIDLEAKAEEGEDIVIDATDYGADPSGAEDSTRAIQAAFAAAKEAKEAGAASVTVSFPTGEYHIYKDYAEVREYHTSNTNSIDSPEKTIGLLIEDQEDFTLDGNGSLFMMHGNIMALAVVNSTNVMLKDFSWDYAVPTVSEMTIVNMDTNEDGQEYTDFYIPKCFPYEISGTTLIWYSEKSPYTGEYYWTEEGIHNAYSIVATQPDEEMTRAYYTSDSPFSGVDNIQQLDDTTIRITYTSTRPTMEGNIETGMILELCSSAYRETAGAFIWESENVTSQDINVHFMHGFGWLLQMSTDIYFYDCNLMPRENSGHVTVSYADGIHASGVSGDLVIENCNFSNTHDDPINIHGTFTRVEERVDDNTLVLKYIHTQQGGFPQFHVGDQVAFFTRDTLESTDDETLYTVAEIISNPGEDGNDLRTMEIRFEETLPEDLSDTIGSEPKYVAENVTYTPKVTIRNCTFRNIPTRGILCTTRQPVLIENNTFYGMSMATIYLSNDSDEWYESGPIRDMTIRGNTFYIKDIGRTSWEYAPAIYIHPVTKGSGLPSEDNPIHKNITIDGNTFYMDEDTVVKAESVENLTFTNNTVLRMEPDVTIEISASTTSLSTGDTVTLDTEATGSSNTNSVDNVFEFTACKNVVIDGNTYDDGLKKYAVLSSMSESNISVGDEDIEIVTSRTKAASDSVADIYYESSDTSVVTVDSEGTVTAVGTGAAMVYACYDWNETTIISNQIEITVNGSTASAEEVEDATYAGLESISIDELSFSLDSPEEGSWFLNADSTQGAVTLEIQADDRIGSLSVLKGYYRSALELEENGNAYTVQLELANGLNSFYIQVTGKDGVTTKQYMLNINYAPSTEVQVDSIEINGEEISGFVSGQSDYLVTLDADCTELQVSAVSENAAKVVVSVNGTAVEGTELTADNLKEGSNDIRVVATAADGITRDIYKIQAIVPYDSDADIYDICVDGESVLGDFDGNTVTVPVTSDTVIVQAVSEDTRAIVKVSNGISFEYDRGSAEKAITLYQGAATVEIQVTSLDGTVTQSWSIVFENAAYLSDLTYSEDSTVGYDSIMKDAASSGSSIRLTDESGNVVTYEKGLGTHADSEIIYDIADLDFTTLTGWCGVDYVKYDSENAAVEFSIQVDGETVFTTEAMSGSAPAEGFVIDVTGASEITLTAVQNTGNNWDAHSDWAYMKLEGEFAEAPEAAADTTELNELLAEAEGIDLSQKTETEIQAFVDAVKEAYALCEKIRNGDSSAVSQMESVAEKLRLATEAIKKEPETESPETETQTPSTGAAQDTGTTISAGASSDGSSTTTATKPKKPKLKVKYKSGKVTLSWQKNTGADQIVIYRRIGNKKYKKIKVISGKKTKITLKVARGKKYTFRIRGRKSTGDGSYIYSKYSTAKKVKAK